jgi:transcriptional regulator with XRE-family HTH domain
LELTQTDVAERMGITQGAYAQLEAKKKIRKSSRIKIALALKIEEPLLDFGCALIRLNA